MNNYKNGKIYKLTSSYTDSIYIGSTIRSLKDRLRDHRSQKGNKTNSHLITKYSDFCIELIENYPCNTKGELLKREGHYIRLNYNICVNKVIPGRTTKEYYQDNKEKLKERSCEYYQDNKEKIKESSSEYYQDNKDKKKEYYQDKNKEYYQDNKEKIKERSSEYYQDNKDKIKEKKREKYRLKNPKPVLKCKELIKKEKKEYDKYRIFWINSFGGRIDCKSYNNNLLHISMDLFN